jgi:hypothetical protein
MIKERHNRAMNPRQAADKNRDFTSISSHRYNF